MTKPAHGQADDMVAVGRSSIGWWNDGVDLYRTLDAAERDGAIDAKPPRSPSSTDEVRFINGIDANGKIDGTSYWGDNGITAYKWGAPTAGTTGGTITYEFDKGSKWTAQEESTFVKGMSLWESIADVHFKEVKSGAANVTFVRGSDGGAYTSLPTSEGHGATLGTPHATGGVISIDTSVKGFDMSGSFDKFGGYGLSTITHELGHLLGLGHGGDYNGDVDPKHQQYSAYDDRMYSIMSYIFWDDTTAKYGSQNPVQGTNWGMTDDRHPIRRQAPHTPMGLDITAIQELYGASKHGPFTGGQTYGFHSNIAGVIHDYYDFTVNTHPVVTLYNQGTGNTLDLSGYTVSSTIDLMPGTFSSMNGMINNLYIDGSTQIDSAIGGSAGDTLIANLFDDRLTGGGGNDMFEFLKGSAADVITDFAEGKDRIEIDAKGVTGFGDLTIGSDGHGGALVSWSGGSSVDLKHVDPASLKAGDFKFDSDAFSLGDMRLAGAGELHHVHAIA